MYVFLMAKPKLSNLFNVVTKFDFNTWYLKVELGSLVFRPSIHKYIEDT